tara:strand:- start:172 stop:975 length:804 start_codon:yes stop_codon:yes gene_type:complete
MRQDGIYGGHPELCAVAEMYRRPIEIWAFDPRVGARVLPYDIGRHFEGIPIRVSYFRGGHYDSIVGRDYNNGLTRSSLGELEKTAIAFAKASQPGQYAAAVAASRQASRAFLGSGSLDFQIDGMMRQSESEYLQHKLERNALRESEATFAEDAMLQAVMEKTRREHDAKNNTKSSSSTSSNFNGKSSTYGSSGGSIGASGAKGGNGSGSGSGGFVNSGNVFYDDTKIALLIGITQADLSRAKVALQAAFGDVNTAVGYIFNPSAMPQ